MQDADGVALGGKHLVETLVAVGRLVETSALENDVRALQPLVHHLRLDKTFALARSGLAVVEKIAAAYLDSAILCTCLRTTSQTSLGSTLLMAIALVMFVVAILVNVLIRQYMTWYAIT